MVRLSFILTFFLSFSLPLSPYRVDKIFIGDAIETVTWWQKSSKTFNCLLLNTTISPIFTAILCYIVCVYQTHHKNGMAVFIGSTCQCEHKCNVFTGKITEQLIYKMAYVNESIEFGGENVAHLC